MDLPVSGRGAFISGSDKDTRNNLEQEQEKRGEVLIGAPLQVLRLGKKTRPNASGNNSLLRCCNGSLRIKSTHDPKSERGSVVSLIKLYFYQSNERFEKNEEINIFFITFVWFVFLFFFGRLL